MMRFLSFVAAVALLATSALAVEGQEVVQRREGEDVHLRNDCRLAVQVLTHGQPANKREWAEWQISACDESGPPVLARMWREVSADSAAVDHMIYLSVFLRDRRTYDAVFAIASDASVPALKRAAALHLLGRWARPGISLEFDPFFRPEYEPAEWHGGVGELRLVFIDHDTQDEGAQPLPESIREEVLRLAREIAVSGADFRLRGVAELLARQLQD